MISRRAHDLQNGSGQFPVYLAEHFSRVSAPSDGLSYIPFCVAENKLMFDTIQEKLQQAKFTEEHTGYHDMIGTPKLRELMAKLLEKRVCKVPVSADELVLSNGCGTTLEQLFWAICDAGEEVMIPAPYYAGFEMDLCKRDQLSLLTCDTSADDGFRLDIERIKETYANASKKPSAFLLTSPYNPVGRVLAEEEVRDLVRWVLLETPMHLVSDEIYALSVYDEEAEFVSSAAIVQQEIAQGSMSHEVWQRVHITYGMSKDMCLSGYRVGVLFTRNAAVRQAIAGTLCLSLRADMLCLQRQCILARHRWCRRGTLRVLLVRRRLSRCLLAGVGRQTACQGEASR
ncbi:MAG: hypothetical protein MHM6MM_003089 [Cercozoa sp. M6MM]